VAAPGSSRIPRLFPQRLRRLREARGPILFPGRKKSASLIYDVGDTPPFGVKIGAAFQHLFVISLPPPFLIAALAASLKTVAEEIGTAAVRYNSPDT
jgi:hypothetical protein